MGTRSYEFALESQKSSQNSNTYHQNLVPILLKPSYFQAWLFQVRFFFNQPEYSFHEFFCYKKIAIWKTKPSFVTSVLKNGIKVVGLNLFCNKYVK